MTKTIGCWTVFLVVALGTPAIAQGPQGEIYGGLVYLRNGTFPQARGNSQLGGPGLGAGYKITFRDEKKFLRPTLALEGDIYFGADFDRYLFTRHDPINSWDRAEELCFTENGYFRPDQCSRCRRRSATGYCEDVDVYARDEFIKYVTAQFGVTAGVKMRLLNGRAQVEPGLTLVVSRMAEGIRTDRLRTTNHVDVLPSVNMLIGLGRDPDFGSAIFISAQVGGMAGTDEGYRIKAGYSHRLNGLLSLGR